jgi:hypothetical protein
MGLFAKPFVDTPLYELTKWVGLAAWVLYPAILGIYCTRKLLQLHK